MVLRDATLRDIPYLAHKWYLEKPKTAFAKCEIEWNEQDCAVFLTSILGKPNYLLAVADRNGITAAIGAVSYKEVIPPHPLLVNEWMWWGDNKRDTVHVLQHAMSWAKQLGAYAIRYVLNVPGQHPTKFVETYRWEVL